MEIRDVYLWLYGVVGCSGKTIEKIENQCNNLKDIFDFSVKTIYNLEGVNEKTKNRILDLKNRAYLDDYKEKLYRKKVLYTVQGDSDYPGRLFDIYDSPKVIFYKGNIERLNKNFSIGMVGSRKPTVYGKECAKKISSELSGYGIDIISGLAIGIDAISQKSCIDSGGITFGVLGSGIDNPLPKTNIGLMNRIVECGGAVISEHGIEKDVKPYYFANRNRIISGLSDGVVVVEAAEKSGALITAEFAAEHGKNVFAVPGSIFSDMSRGCHNLIKDGAKPVSGIIDILESYEFMNISAASKKDKQSSVQQIIDDESDIIVSVIKKHGEIGIDSICEFTGMNINKVNPAIEKLKLYDIVIETSAGKYSLRI